MNQRRYVTLLVLHAASSQSQTIQKYRKDPEARVLKYSQIRLLISGDVRTNT